MRNIYIDLFLTFARIGLFTFGGGYAMIPLIQKEAAENKHWVSDEEILDVVAIAESTPGPIAVNAATFIGSRTAGAAGAACATLGVVLPSFLIIAALSYVLKAFEQFKVVQYAFRGIRAGVLALILKALWSLFRNCRKDVLSYVLIAFAFFARIILKVDVIIIILICAAAGIVSSLITTSAGKKVGP